MSVVIWRGICVGVQWKAFWTTQKMRTRKTMRTSKRASNSCWKAFKMCVLRWWQAVRRGDRTIADGPPSWLKDFAA
jgi:hypothetical protein